MSNLFEITNEYAQLLEMLTDPEVDNEIVEDTLVGIKCELEQKAQGYVSVIHQLEMEARACKSRVEFFQEKQRIRENAIKRMKEALVVALNETGNDKGLEAGDYVLKVQKNGGLQPLVIDGEVPNNMQKIIYENDNAKIREFLKDNTCDWAHLEPRGVHLVIK